MTIKAGQVVTFKPEWLDKGDEGITFLAVDDESKGRVTVEAQVDLPFKPRQVVTVDMIASVAPVTLLTPETATAYVVALFASYGEEYNNLAVTRTTYLGGDPAIDVSFTYGHGHFGTMTVWVEADGNLYGEW